MNTKLQKQLRQRKRKLDKRIDKSTGFNESRIRGGKVKYELSEKQQAIACGGLGMILQMASELKLRQHINRATRRRELTRQTANPNCLFDRRSIGAHCNANS